MESKSNVDIHEVVTTLFSTSKLPATITGIPIPTIIDTKRKIVWMLKWRVSIGETNCL